MTIVPAPTADETAAILVALASATPERPADERAPEVARWRLAVRDYAGGALRREALR